MREAQSEWGQPLVIDMSWFDEMLHQQQSSLFHHELPFVHSYNRWSPMPYHLHFTSCKFPDMNRLMSKFFVNHLKTPEKCAEVFTEKSHLDLFNPRRLVYLSPDSRNELTYNGNDIYVIGGLVDTTIIPNASLSTAKSQNIRHACFPMQKYLGFREALNLEQVVGILLDYRMSRDWFYAFRWVPPRRYKVHCNIGLYDPQKEQHYRARDALFPSNFWSDLGRMNHTLYRQKYDEIFKNPPLLEPEDIPDRSQKNENFIRRSKKDLPKHKKKFKEYEVDDTFSNYSSIIMDSLMKK